VTILDDLSGGFVENLTDGARFVKGSINDVDRVNGLFTSERYDYVYHLAAHAAEALSHFVKRFNYENNLMGSVNLINAAINAGTECFVFASSIAVYGKGPELPMTEEMAPHPEDPYGIAKLAVEQELRVSKEMFDLDYVIFRPHNVYGECQNIGDRYRNVVGIFMNQILRDEPMTIFGDGTQTRAFSYVGDVVPIMADAMSLPAARNQVFNIGADQPCRIVELAEETARAMGVPRKLIHLPTRKEVQHVYASHEKLRSLFGKREPHSLRDGLGRMAEWVKKHGKRSCQRFDRIEVAKNMPQAWVAADREISSVEPGSGPQAPGKSPIATPDE